jgi:pimeloyl-ACP methyl ester carboxylesterase
MPTVCDQFVDLGADQIFARLVMPAKAARPTVVLLHDGLGSVATWKSFPVQLAEAAGLPVVAYDRSGHGRSSSARHTDTLDLDHEVSVVLPALLQALDIRRPILLGHSDGGTIALLAAERVDASAVIVEAAHVIMEEAMRAGIRALVAEWNEGALRRKLSRYHGSQVTQMFSRWSSTWLSRPYDGWTMVDHLARIAAPVLALQGVADSFGTPRQLDMIARHCGGAVRTVLLPGCGHVPHHECPRDVLDLIGKELAAYARDTVPPAPD